jgi:hypothetical protein
VSLLQQFADFQLTRVRSRARTDKPSPKHLEARTLSWETPQPMRPLQRQCPPMRMPTSPNCNRPSSDSWRSSPLLLKGFTYLPLLVRWAAVQPMLRKSGVPYILH